MLNLLLSNSVTKIKFVFLVAPFRSRSKCHDFLFENGGKVEIPSLVVVGDDDKVIEAEMTQAILDKFENLTLVRHEGGHFVPAKAKEKLMYNEFLDKFQ